MVPEFGSFRHDRVALAEIELYGDVLTAVAAADHRLSLDELDRALGVPARPSHGPRAPAARSACPGRSLTR